MNIQEARQEIIRTIKAYTAREPDGSLSIPAVHQRPLLLIGPPGIGKTAVMSQAARSCGVGFVSYTMTHHTRQSALGLPYIEHRNYGGREYAVTEYTMSEIIASVYRCMEESGCEAGLLFLDEINCVSETLAPVMLQFLQNKTFGSHRLPEGWVIAAAGNPPEYNKSVREYDIATLDRLKYITVEADYDAWRSYALAGHVHGAVLSYLDTHSSRFYLLHQTYTERSFVTARGWEDLSRMLREYEKLGVPADAGLISQYLHEEELAQDFAGYYGLYLSKQRSIPVAEMLSGDPAALLSCQTLLSKSSFDDRIQILHLLLSCLDDKLNDWKRLRRKTRLTKDALDRLQRFRQQQKLRTVGEAVEPFLAKEREILKIREEHGLSSWQELVQLRQILKEVGDFGYRLRAKSGLALRNRYCYCSGDPVYTEHTESLHRDVVKKPEEDGTPDAADAYEAATVSDFLRKLDEDCADTAATILAMLERAMQTISADKNKDSGQHETARTFFVASLYQNPVAAEFFRVYPQHACAPYRDRLDFSAREHMLREMLTGKRG